MEIKRGDIWYVSKDNYTGCEQAAGRQAIIVSNEKNNACAETVWCDKNGVAVKEVGFSV